MQRTLEEPPQPPKLFQHHFDLFADLIETSQDAIIALSPEFKILTFNHAAELMFDYSRDEIIGQSAFNLVPLGRGGELQEKLKRVHAGEAIAHYETLRMKKDGTRFNVSIRISAIRNNHDELTGFSWILRDVTDKKAAESLIQKLSSVVEQTADMVMITDKQGIVEYINPAFSTITGYKKEEVIGFTSKILKSGKHSSSFYKQMWETLLAGQPFQATMANKKKDGTLFFCEKTITPLFREDKTISHFVSTDKDITDKKLAEEQAQAELRRSNTQLEEFASIASHDLQEPLRTITCYLQLFASKNKLLLDSDSKDYLRFALTSSQRLQKLIQDLLIYSKVGMGKISSSEFKSLDAVNEALDLLRESISRNKVRVKIGPLPVIKADKNRMVQVFQNLISNAIKYKSAKPPTIQITAHSDKKEWTFKISDNGIGIPRESNSKIFKLFQRLHRKTEIEGTGIGLAICQKIVEQAGGKIWVESKPDKGSEFYFTVPKTP